MKNVCLTIVLSFIFLSCKSDLGNQISESENEIFGEDIPVLDFENFEPYLNIENDKIYVINFWATWCKPCIKELPVFEAINQNYRKKGVEVILVSLDFSEKLESDVLPFVERHNLQSKIALLDDTDSNTWIPKVNEDWSGAIPATLIYNKDMRKFYERSFTYEELETELKNF